MATLRNRLKIAQLFGTCCSTLVDRIGSSHTGSLTNPARSDIYVAVTGQALAVSREHLNELKANCKMGSEGILSGFIRARIVHASSQVCIDHASSSTGPESSSFRLGSEILRCHLIVCASPVLS